MSSVSSDSLSDQAYSYILHKIITFEYKPSEPIIETEICSELNISRTPLREALRRLEAEGFVIKARNRGTFVRSYTQEDIIENCEIRIMIELYSLPQCIEFVSQEEIDHVRQMLEAIENDSDPEAFFASDTALHNMITQYCRNSRMRNILTSLAVQLDAVQEISSHTSHRLEESKREHMDILNAIDARDLDHATQLLRTHLENVKNSCVQAFQKMRIEKMGF